MNLYTHALPAIKRILTSFNIANNHNKNTSYVKESI